MAAIQFLGFETGPGRVYRKRSSIHFGWLTRFFDTIYDFMQKKCRETQWKGRFAAFRCFFSNKRYIIHLLLEKKQRNAAKRHFHCVSRHFFCIESQIVLKKRVSHPKWVDDLFRHTRPGPVSNPKTVSQFFRSPDDCFVKLFFHQNMYTTKTHNLTIRKF